MEIYVVDTHALVWYFTGESRLSISAENLLDRAEEAEIQVLISTIVLAEIAHISHKKRIQISIQDVLKRIEEGDGFVVVPFDFTIFQAMLTLPDELEIHDRIIAATGKHYKASIITKDASMQKAREVETVW